ncbi:MAG: tryptophan--tRNA ligase [Planctomycetota bacterium]
MARILSGIQPSGNLHIGNYFGAIVQYKAMQEEGNECFFFIADYHALTSSDGASVLRQNNEAIAVDYLALGLDPAKANLFRQSDIPEVTELAWILSTVTPMGLLERAHSYKDKVARGLEANHGLFAYPVLMAADILIYQSNLVPVGQDQKQHLEMTRDIAERFNHRYGEVFVIPEPRIRPEVAVIPGTDGQKMSKSYGNTIDFFAPEAAIRKRVMGIVTDSTPMADPKNPDRCNLFTLFKLFASPDERQAMAARYRAGGLGYGDVKKRLLELILEHFKPFREARTRFLTDPAPVKQALADGAARARAVAQDTMNKVREAVGLR